jgi:phospholipid/cholesterol/gamma-HCH transport system substrate-binding protein
MTRRLAYVLIGTLLMVALGAGIFYSVKWAYGGFGDYYYLTARLDRAGQQMETGLDVRIRGVKVGTVSGIELVDRQAELTLQIEQNYEVPDDAIGVISLKTPLGSKYVDLQFDPTTGASALQDGDHLASARVGPELEDLLDDGVHVLDAIDPDDIAVILTELSTAADGRGDTVAAGIQANADLSDLFAATLDPQLQTLDDFETIFGELEKVGVDLNELAAAVNEGAPVYASAEAQENLRVALETVVPFADNLADLLILNRSDWDRMIDNGDIVLGTIAARPQGLHDLVHGLYRYVYKLGGEIDPFFSVEDGSAGAGFSAFIGGNDQEEEEKQICEVFPEPIHDEIPICSGGGP